MQRLRIFVRSRAEGSGAFAALPQSMKQSACGDAVTGCFCSVVARFGNDRAA